MSDVKAIADQLVVKSDKKLGYVNRTERDNWFVAVAAGDYAAPVFDREAGEMVWQAAARMAIFPKAAIVDVREGEDGSVVRLLDGIEHPTLLPIYDAIRAISNPAFSEQPIFLKSEGVTIFESRESPGKQLVTWRTPVDLAKVAEQVFYRNSARKADYIDIPSFERLRYSSPDFFLHLYPFSSSIAIPEKTFLGLVFMAGSEGWNGIDVGPLVNRPRGKVGDRHFVTALADALFQGWLQQKDAAVQERFQKFYDSVCDKDSKAPHRVADFSMIHLSRTLKPWLPGPAAPALPARVGIGDGGRLSRWFSRSSKNQELPEKRHSPGDGGFPRLGAGPPG